MKSIAQTNPHKHKHRFLAKKKRCSFGKEQALCNFKQNAEAEVEKQVPETALKRKTFGIVEWKNNKAADSPVGSLTSLSLSMDAGEAQIPRKMGKGRSEKTLQFVEMKVMGEELEREKVGFVQCAESLQPAVMLFPSIFLSIFLLVCFC